MKMRSLIRKTVFIDREGVIGCRVLHRAEYWIVTGFDSAEGIVHIASGLNVESVKAEQIGLEWEEYEI